MSLLSSDLWREIKEQLSLTPQEQAVAFFLILSAGAGIAIKWINLSVPKMVGAKYYSEPLMPKAQPKDTSKSVRTAPARSPFPIDINSADSAALVRVPGIGPVIAGRIIQYRRAHGEFRSVDELKNVKGIGDKKLSKIRKFVSLGSGNDKNRSRQH